MFEKVLLPLDSSELAEKALPYGVELSRRLDAELILFHACGSGHYPHKHDHKLYMDSVTETLARNLREGQPEGTRRRITVQIEDGEPSENICNFVDKGGIGLVIMTSIGASGPKVAMLGRVADRICRTVPIPVMLIRPHVKPVESQRRLINRILVPLDGSDLSELALSAAEELAARLKVPIDLFQMARVVYSYGGEPAPFVDYEKLTQDEEKRVRTEMTALGKRLAEKGITVAWSVTSGTDAAEEIIRVSETVRADLIVMSTHGRSGLSHLVVGSVAEKVLRQGETPLLLVHAGMGLVH